MFGLPYKGSKSRIALEFMQYLPKAEHFYDLFLGGGAVTHAAIYSGRWKHFHANDINPLLPQLFMDAVKGRHHGVRRWVSRAEFMEHKDTDGLVAVCWSFGNNLRNYLYNEEVEPYKKMFHEAVAYGDYEPLRPFGIDLSPIERWSNMYRRRIEAQNIVRTLQLDENLSRLVTCETLARYERLQSLERLYRFRQAIETTTLSYDKVEILPDSVIYVDPPYKGTDGYGAGFDHAKFYDWCLRQQNIYISEYEMPDEFEMVAEIPIRTTLARNSNSTPAVERLFVPKGQKYFKPTLF